MYLSGCLTHLPKPNDLLAIPVVVAINGVALPIVDINLLHAAQHQLQFTFVKVFKPLQRHHFVEALEECARLLLDSSAKFHQKCEHFRLAISQPNAVSYRVIRQSVISPMYSSLFSSVTRILSPSSLSSWWSTCPSTSKSTPNHSSRPHSSMLLSRTHTNEL